MEREKAMEWKLIKMTWPQLFKKNHTIIYPVDSSIDFPNTYPLDIDLMNSAIQLLNNWKPEEGN